MGQADWLASLRHDARKGGAEQDAGREPGPLQRLPGRGTGLGPAARRRGQDIKIFFLSCVIVAGLFGAVTVSKRILFVQAVPAVIALVLTLLG